MFIDNQIKQAVKQGHTVYHFEDNTMTVLQNLGGMVVAVENTDSHIPYTEGSYHDVD